jgi:phospholipid/cholesterol/gamma-HCH transport system ATP-binding protein
MNSVLEIGEKVMFLYKGHKIWEGDNNTIIQSDITELNEFVFASKRLREMRR